MRDSAWQIVTLSAAAAPPFPFWGPSLHPPRDLVSLCHVEAATHFNSPAFPPFFLIGHTFPHPRLLRAPPHFSNNESY